LYCSIERLRVEKQMANETKWGKKLLGQTSDFGGGVPEPNEEHSVWVENGEVYTAPTVDRSKFGGHDYDGGGYEKGVRDCKCGAYMLSASSAGPVDPFGACPMNPKTKRLVTDNVTDGDRAKATGIATEWQDEYNSSARQEIDFGFIARFLAELIASTRTSAYAKGVKDARIAVKNMPAGIFGEIRKEDALAAIDAGKEGE
jgi:hypothetical protein